MTAEPTHARLTRASRLLGALAVVVELSLDSRMEGVALAACFDVAEFVEETARAATGAEPVAIVDKPQPLSAFVDTPVLQQAPKPEHAEAAGDLGLVITAPSDQPEVRPAPKDTRQKTPERVELLRELYVAGGPTKEEIRRRLNLLPGAEIPAANFGPFVIHWGIATSCRDELRPTRPPTLRDIVARDREVASAGATPRPSLTPPAGTRTTIADLAAAANARPVRADADTIRSWAAQRGIEFGKNDLGPVNSKRRQLQLPPFELEQPTYGR